MVEQLCTHGADTEAGIRTSLDYAVELGRLEVCSTLLRYGANPNALDIDRISLLNKAKRKTGNTYALAVVHLLECKPDRPHTIQMLQSVFKH